MSWLANYFVFLFWLAVGLAGASLFLKTLIEQFFTDRSLADYKLKGRILLPSWGYATSYEQVETSLLSLLTRRLARIPPTRRVAELEIKLHGD